LINAIDSYAPEIRLLITPERESDPLTLTTVRHTNQPYDPCVSSIARLSRRYDYAFKSLAVVRERRDFVSNQFIVSITRENNISITKANRIATGAKTPCVGIFCPRYPRENLVNMIQK
jgi:hypothetical protein